jgi:hypothetical protein
MGSWHCAIMRAAARDGLIVGAECSIVSRFFWNKAKQYQCDTEFE